jgi:hypothetical protein
MQNQVIYINWNLGSHTYTMTVNLEREVQSWALQSLIDWARFNSNRIKSWSVDESSFATSEQFNTVRGLINAAIPDLEEPEQETEQDTEQVIEKQAEEVIAEIEQSITVGASLYALQKKKAKLEAKVKSIEQSLRTLEKYKKYEPEAFDKTMLQLRIMGRYFERNLETTYKDIRALIKSRNQ